MESLALIADAGLAFEFLTFTRHLPAVVKVMERIPHLRAVINHLSKPEIKAGRLEPWRARISEVALHANVYCKLSGMVTEADYQSWTVEQLRPYANYCQGTWTNS